MFNKFNRAILVSLLLIFTPATHATELNHWPAEAATKLNSLIKTHANKGEYAVFDMDNTSYRHDLSEALLAYLDNKGILTRDHLDPALKLIPFKDIQNEKEGLYSYYLRLCEVDDLICYPWIAQSFSGLTLRELKGHVDELIASQKAITVRYIEGDKIVNGTVYPPRIFTGMIELYHKLQENGIDVYVMTAANEELVRMVASDPQYGYNVKPQNVIGVNVLLKNPQTGELVTARKQIMENRYVPNNNLDLQVTAYLVNPMTWFEGKAGSILGWIDQWRKPILTGGDTVFSDTFMLLNSTDIERGGMRIWISRKPETLLKLKTLLSTSAQEQRKLGQEVTADKNWLIIEADKIQ